MGAMSKRTRATLCGAVIGAVGGLWITWSTAVCVAVMTGGIDGLTIGWAIDAAKSWQIAGICGCAFLGLWTPNRLNGMVGWHMCWLIFANGGAIVGTLAGEYLRARWEEDNMLDLDWTPWPGGCGMVVGIVLGYLFFRVSRHKLGLNLPGPGA